MHDDSMMEYSRKDGRRIGTVLSYSDILILGIELKSNGLWGRGDLANSA